MWTPIPSDQINDQFHLWLIFTGQILDSAKIGILAGAGYQNVTVRAPPKVALLSTGNELQEPSEVKLKPAHIRDSNRTMLRVLLK